MFFWLYLNKIEEEKQYQKREINFCYLNCESWINKLEQAKKEQHGDEQRKQEKTW